MLKKHGQECFDVSVRKNLITVPGRVLAEPTIRYKDIKDRDKSHFTREGSWNMQNIKVNVGEKLKRWSALSISKRGCPNLLDEVNLLELTMSELCKSLIALGMTANQPLAARRLAIRDPYDKELDAILEKASGGLDLLLVVLPKLDTALYNRIKQLSDVKFGSTPSALLPQSSPNNMHNISRMWLSS